MCDKVCELVSLTHQHGDTFVSDNERVVVTGSARSVGPSPASHQCRLSAVIAGLTLAQRWLHVSGVYILCSLYTGNIRPHQSYTYTLIAKPTQDDTGDRNIG